MITREQCLHLDNEAYQKEVLSQEMFANAFENIRKHSLRNTRGRVTTFYPRDKFCCK